MANNSTEKFEAMSPPPRWQKVLRQNSVKLTQDITVLASVFAEEVVLPTHQRTLSRSLSRKVPTTPEAEALQDVQSDSIFMPRRMVSRSLRSTNYVAPMQEPIQESPYPTKESPLDMYDSSLGNESLQQQKYYFPSFILVLSFIQVLMFIVLKGFPVQKFGYDPYRRHEIWRLITTMLVYKGLFHLSTTICMQFILGFCLEIVHNWKRIAIIYFSSLLGGSLFITVLSPRDYAIGASAGVYGLLFSHLSTTILHWSDMDKKFWRLFSLLMLIFIYISASVTLEYADTNYAAQLGGGVTGFLVAFLVLKNFKKHQWQTNIQIISIVILVCICIIVIVVNLCAPDLYLPTDWSSNYESSYRNHIFKLAITSPEDSEIRKFCKQYSNCKLLLNQYYSNSTTESTSSVSIRN